MSFDDYKESAVYVSFMAGAFFYFVAGILFISFILYFLITISSIKIILAYGFFFIIIFSGIDFILKIILLLGCKTKKGLLKLLIPQLFIVTIIQENTIPWIKNLK